MPIFTSKDKDKNRSVNFMAVDGLPEYQLGDAINATIVKNENVLRIKARVFKRPIINLPINKILSAVFASETEILEKDKSVIGRAAVGTLLLGPLGTIVGGMSGIGAKHKREIKNFLLISYAGEDEEKTIVFEVIGASIGWAKFLKELNALIPNKPEQKTSITL